MGVKRPWRVCATALIHHERPLVTWVIATYSTEARAERVAAILRAEESEVEHPAKITVEGPNINDVMLDAAEGRL